MPERFVFRQVYTPDIELFAKDGEIRAKNHGAQQKCHQTSYVELVERRGTAEFAVPCGGVVNDYVPFYFSPFTSFCFTIYRENVHLRAPDGTILGLATQADRSFVVYKASTLIDDPALVTYFSNTSLNNMSIEIEFGSTVAELSNVVRWPLFDESPLGGHIPEIGYAGSCRYFLDRAEPEAHQDRNKRRMAEFLVRESVPLNLAACIVTPSTMAKSEVDTVFAAHNVEVPVLYKPGCFF